MGARLPALHLRLGDARKRLGNPPALALTATATPRVREDIAERLRLDNPRVIVAPAHRENLGLTVDIVPGAAKFPAAARRIKRLQRPGIIYCATTTAVDEVSGALGRARSAIRLAAVVEPPPRKSFKRTLTQTRGLNDLSEVRRRGAGGGASCNGDQREACLPHQERRKNARPLAQHYWPVKRAGRFSTKAR